MGLKDADDKFGYIDENNQLQPYPTDVNDRILVGSTFQYTAGNNQTYKVYPVSMIQENVEYGTTKKIKKIDFTPIDNGDGVCKRCAFDIHICPICNMPGRAKQLFKA